MRASGARLTAVGIAAIASILIAIAPGVASPGDPDSGFGTNGWRSVSLGTGPYEWLEYRDVAIQPDGKIVAAGEFWGSDDSYGRLIVSRFNADGSLDSAYGVDGTTVSPSSSQGLI
jgi:hypothetical protein